MRGCERYWEWVKKKPNILRKKINDEKYSNEEHLEHTEGNTHIYMSHSKDLKADKHLSVGYNRGQETPGGRGIAVPVNCIVVRAKG